MLFDGVRQPNTIYVASISYGKDSLAMLEAIKILGLPLDRIVTAEIWATDTIQADLPPMVAFKDHADKIIKQRYGIDVEHFRANKTYEDKFFSTRGERSKRSGEILGWPMIRGAWCNSLKMDAISIAKKSCKGCVEYIGIAADEQERIERHSKRENVIMPLVEIGWSEKFCRQWCEENDLLSPIYQDAARGGCWFCHNQGVEQLRKLRKNYPELWRIMLSLDLSSPVSFKPEGKTVHDYDERFQWEDDGFIPDGKAFRWADIEQPQMNFWQLGE